MRRPRVRNVEERFERRVLPLFARKSKKVADLIPELYLHGLAEGDFDLALRGLLGDEAPVSASTVARLKEKWHAELAEWRQRPLDDLEVVYMWVDGVLRQGRPGKGEGGPTDPELRVRDLEQDGVDAEVVYGILAAGSLITDHDLRNFVYETYNTWAADFRRASPDRLAPLACIPNTDPQVAATELRRSAGLGLRGGELAVSTAVLPIWDRAWDPLWAASDECEVPISFHTTGLQVTKHADQELAREYEAQRSGTFASTFQIAGSEYLAAIIFSGALERYPGMRFVLGECGVGWIPYMLARMDEEYDDLTRLHRLAPRKPSEYWHRQGYTTFQHELNLLPEIVRLVGEDNILWVSDYPHFDGVWPDSRSIIQQDLALLDDGARQKITCENAGRLYGFIK